jgi:hypothetical protein
MTLPKLPLLVLALITVGATILSRADAPAGWFLAGSDPSAYVAGATSEVARTGTTSAYLASQEPTQGFGTLMQMVEADAFRGERVRMRAYVKADSVAGWAGLWMRVDGEEAPLAFDNMQDRPITGTADWEAYEIVLGVPEGATHIAYGVLLNGGGRVYFDGLTFEGATFEEGEPSLPVVEDDGSRVYPPAPMNLDFER